jgi:cytochrome c oxidase subunit 4
VSAPSSSAPPLKLHAAVFGSLLGLTWLTVQVAGIDLGPWNTALALGIASLKASLVLLYFMHLRWSHRLTWVFAASGLFFLVILITLTLSDFMTRDRLPIYGPAALETPATESPAHASRPPD